MKIHKLSNEVVSTVVVFSFPFSAARENTAPCAGGGRGNLILCNSSSSCSCSISPEPRDAAEIREVARQEERIDTILI